MEKVVGFAFQFQVLWWSQGCIMNMLFSMVSRFQKKGVLRRLVNPFPENSIIAISHR